MTTPPLHFASYRAPVNSTQSEIEQIRKQGLLVRLVEHSRRIDQGETLIELAREDMALGGFYSDGIYIQRALDLASGDGAGQLLDFASLAEYAAINAPGFELDPVLLEAAAYLVLMRADLGALDPASALKAADMMRASGLIPG